MDKSPCLAWVWVPETQVLGLYLHTGISFTHKHVYTYTKYVIGFCFVLVFFLRVNLKPVTGCS